MRLSPHMVRTKTFIGIKQKGRKVTKTTRATKRKRKKKFRRLSRSRKSRKKRKSRRKKKRKKGKRKATVKRRKIMFAAYLKRYHKRNQPYIYRVAIRNLLKKYTKKDVLLTHKRNLKISSSYREMFNNNTPKQRLQTRKHIILAKCLTLIIRFLEQRKMFSKIAANSDLLYNKILSNKRLNPIFNIFLEKFKYFEKILRRRLINFKNNLTKRMILRKIRLLVIAKKMVHFLYKINCVKSYNYLKNTPYLSDLTLDFALLREMRIITLMELFKNRSKRMLNKSSQKWLNKIFTTCYKLTKSKHGKY